MIWSSRASVVEAADAARASLERDLHDGVQQRLVALRYALGLATARATRLPDQRVAAKLADADKAAEQDSLTSGCSRTGSARARCRWRPQ